MGKSISKSSNTNGKTNKNKDTSNYINFVNRTAKENDRVDIGMGGNEVDHSKAKERNVDVLLQRQIRRRPLSAFLHSGADGLYVWFIATWLRLKQKHYSELHESRSSMFSQDSRRCSRENNDEQVVTERPNSTTSHDLDLADISDGSGSNDSGRSDVSSQGNHLDIYNNKPYCNERENVLQDVVFTNKIAQSHNRTRSGSQNPSFSLHDER